ncbi:transposase [Paenibacillus amylolyticus]|uniref:Transposase n=1 Tax=Paenibacillus amylolyticus TaxID=1451 RepID=A0A100VPK4_PAEAM|nr:transposase [Paenibacillus amylolyticus]
MPDRTALSMEIALGVAISQYPPGTFLTATADRGKEFAYYANLETTHNLHVYFADPYSSWQRGSNENANGLLREFFPKGTDLAGMDVDDLAHSLHQMNHRPRKCLGLKTAHESFTKELSHLV